MIIITIIGKPKLSYSFMKQKDGQGPEVGEVAPLGRHHGIPAMSSNIADIVMREIFPGIISLQ